MLSHTSRPAIAAMEAGANVLVEKSMAHIAANAEKAVATGAPDRKKLVIGYILRHHTSWIRFIEIARQLGTLLVFRMNFNQQSNGQTREGPKWRMGSFAPIVDCNVRYVDVMCQMTEAKPVKVHVIGTRLTDEVPVDNYGMLQVIFNDGSAGWYEAGWGLAKSETALIGPVESGSRRQSPFEACGPRASSGRRHTPHSQAPGPAWDCHAGSILTAARG